MTREHRSAGAQVAALSATRLVAGLVSAATSLVVIHALSKVNYGDYGIALGIAGMLVVASDLGLTSALARYVAQAAVGSQTARTAIVVKLALAVAAGVGLALLGGGCSWIAHALGHHLPSITVFAAAGALVVGRASQSLADGLLPAARRVWLLVGLAAFGPVVELGAVLGALHAGFGVAGALAASAIAAALVGIAGLAVIARFLHGQTVTTDVGFRAVRRYSGPVFLVGLCFVVFGQIDQLVLYAIRGPQQAAGYIAVWRLVSLLNLPGLAAGIVIAPRLAKGGAAARNLYRTWSSLLLITYAGIAAIAAGVAEPLTRVFLGSRYASSGSILVALSVYVALLGVAPLVTMAANYRGGAAQRVRLSIVTVVANVVLDIALVPSLGVYGAAIGTSVAFAWYVASHEVLLRKLLNEDDRRDKGAVAAERGRRRGAAGVWSMPKARTVRVGLGVFLLAGLLGSVAWLIVQLLAPKAGDIVALLTAAASCFVAYGACIAGAYLLIRRSAATTEDGPSESLKILHIADFSAPYPGAFIRQLQMLSDELAGRDDARIVLAFPERARHRSWLARLREDGFEVHLLPEPAPRPQRATVAAISELLEQTSCAIVHAHFGTYDQALAVAVARRKRRGAAPYMVWHYRTALEEGIGGRSWRRRLKDVLKFRWYGRHASLCVGVTQAMADEAAARGMGERAIAVVAGCDTDTFCVDDEARAEQRATLGLAEDETLVLHLGWHWQRKGGDLLARAAQILHERGHDKLVFASVGAPADEVEAPVRALAPTDEIWRLHQASDIFVSASRSEGFGNGLVEALACERVAVAAAADGQIEIFAGLDGCRSVPIDDAVAIADAIEDLLATRAAWPTWGAQNRAHIVRRNSMRRWAREMADRYAQMLTGRVAAAPAADARTRVLTVIDGLTAGGAERVAVELACALDRERYHAHVLVTRSTGPLQQLLDDQGIPYTLLNRRRRIDLRAFRRARALVRESDVVHAHKLGSAFWASLLVRGTGVPLVAHDHNWANQFHRAHAVAERRFVAPVARRIICVSESVAAAARRRGIAARKLTVVPNGVRTDVAWPRTAARRELGLRADATVVGIVAALRPEKGHEVLLAALAQLRKGGLKPLLCVVGDGPCRGELRERARKLGVLDQIVWAGEHDNAARLAGAFDIAVIASLWEGLPLAALEAMAARTPLVTTAVGELPELVAHGCGLAVAAGDAGALAGALAQMLEDPAAGRQMAQRGQARVGEQFSFAQTVHTIEALYDELTADPAMLDATSVPMSSRAA